MTENKINKVMSYISMVSYVSNYARQTCPYLFEDNYVHIEFEKTNMKGMTNKELGCRKKKKSRKNRRKV